MRHCKILFFAVLFGTVSLWAALSETVRDNFILSCEDGGASETFCACVFSKVEKKYSQQQIDAIELKMRRGHSDLGYTNFVKKASEECNAKLRSGTSLGALAAEEAENPRGNLSQKELDVLTALGFEEAFAAGFVEAIVNSPEYKNLFVAECAVEIYPYLGKGQSAKSCECAYQKLIDENNVKTLVGLMDENGELDDSLALELFLPCLPQKFTPEMEKFLRDSCLTAASEKVCNCIIDEIKSQFSLEQLIRKTLDDSEFIQKFSTRMEKRCRE